MLKLYKELKRRKVLTTLGVYGAAAFIIIQVADIVFTRLLLPDWTVTFVIVLAILGFPITFFFSWTYDLKQDAKMDDNSDKKYTKIVLPLTGFLTIVGGAFWFWYSLGNITSGSDLDLEMGIKKSIAVFNFENLSGEKAGDFLCAGIRANIHSQLTKLGKLDVKSRSVNNKNQIKDLDLDYFTITYSDIDGSWEGEGNINSDPLFCNADSSDFTLYDNSPCVGTGQDGANMGAFGVGCYQETGNILSVFSNEIEKLN